MFKPFRRTDFPFLASEEYLHSFAALSLLASFLLFFVQPMIAKMALPQLGGNPAVWTSAMVAFQLLLLAGYGYAHMLQRFALKHQALVHCAALLLALLCLPISFNAASPPSGDALVVWVPWRVAMTVGPLFVLLAAQAPLVQSWFRDSGTGGEPYRLYAWSNAGSFLGLLAYPLLVEPFTALDTQRTFWSAGFGLLALATLGMLFLASKAAPVARAQSASTIWPDIRTALRWMTLAAIPSGLILSTTTHITTDIIAMPLLWVLPLALYLLSFVLAFREARGLIDHVATYAAPLIALLALIALSTDDFEVQVTGSASMALLLVASLALHRQLFNERPPAEGLTAFYLILAAGGALGGILVAIAAPLVFDWTYEFPVLIIAAIAMLHQRGGKTGPIAIGVALAAMPLAAAVALQWIELSQILLAGLFALPLFFVWRSKAVMLCVTLCGILALTGFDALILSANNLRQRSYFGIYTVRENETGTVRKLAHGTTTHGAQRLEPGKLLQPTTYFGPQSGAGQILTAAPALYSDKARIAVLGLGVGTLSCYAKPSQTWSFYEIDPLVADIAIKQGWFTYMINCAPNAAVRIGDARLTLAQQPTASLDILVMDVFSSDAVPTHLLTREAFAIYDRVLAKDGALLIHISNRYLDLEPVLASEAKARRWTSAIITHNATPEQIDAGETTSVWVMMARSEDMLQRARNAAAQTTPAKDSEWKPLSEKQGFARWTDEFGSILHLIKRPDQAE